MSHTSSVAGVKIHFHRTFKISTRSFFCEVVHARVNLTSKGNAKKKGSKRREFSIWPNEEIPEAIPKRGEIQPCNSLSLSHVHIRKKAPFLLKNFFSLTKTRKYT